MTMRCTLEFWKDKDWYVGCLREVPGVFSQGRTIRELEENIRDAYRMMCLERRIPRRRTKRKAIAIAA